MHLHHMPGDMYIEITDWHGSNGGNVLVIIQRGCVKYCHKSIGWSVRKDAHYIIFHFAHLDPWSHWCVKAYTHHSLSPVLLQ